MKKSNSEIARRILELTAAFEEHIAEQNRVLRERAPRTLTGQLKSFLFDVRDFDDAWTIPEFASTFYDKCAGKNVEDCTDAEKWRRLKGINAIQQMLGRMRKESLAPVIPIQFGGIVHRGKKNERAEVRVIDVRDERQAERWLAHLNTMIEGLIDYEKLAKDVNSNLNLKGDRKFDEQKIWDVIDNALKTRTKINKGLIARKKMFREQQREGRL